MYDFLLMPDQKTSYWCLGAGSNRRPFALQANALPTELPKQINNHFGILPKIRVIAIYLDLNENHQKVNP